MICVSNATANDVIKNYNTDRAKISIAYNGVRKEFQPLDKNKIASVRNKYSEGQPFFLFVGAIHPRKNVIKMIHAFDKYKNLSDSDTKFVIVGRKAWHNQEMEEAFNSASHKSDIIFTGYLDLKNWQMLRLALLPCFMFPCLKDLACL